MTAPSRITIEVEFLAGTSIHEAIAEAKQKATLWQVCYVTFKFNGVRCSIGSGCDVDVAAKDYLENGNSKYGICHR